MVSLRCQVQGTVGRSGVFEVILGKAVRKLQSEWVTGCLVEPGQRLDHAPVRLGWIHTRGAAHASGGLDSVKVPIAVVLRHSPNGFHHTVTLLQRPAAARS